MTKAKRAVPREQLSWEGHDKLTKDSFAADLDPNRIIARYAQGIPTNNIRRNPQYGEAPAMDYFTASCIAAEAASAEEVGLPLGGTPTEDPIVESQASEAVSEDSNDDPTPPEGPPEDAA